MSEQITTTITKREIIKQMGEAGYQRNWELFKTFLSNDIRLADGNVIFHLPNILNIVSHTLDCLADTRGKLSYTLMPNQRLGVANLVLSVVGEETEVFVQIIRFNFG